MVMKNKILLFLMMVLAITMNGQTTTWNGTSWSAGVPSSTVDAIIAGNYSSTLNVNVKNITINAGTIYTIPSGSRLVIYGNFVNNGSIILNNDAIVSQLSDTSTYSGTGTATVRRIANLKRNDYNYWSSPVTGQNLFNFSTGTPSNYFYKYNEANDKFVTTGLTASSIFEPGIGYAIRGKNTYSLTTSAPDTFSFTGALNNGTIVVPLKRSAGADKGYNLVGNPYSSNIAFKVLFNSFANKNSIFNKQWFWSNLNELKYQQGSSYSGNNYATFVSGVGGVGPSYVSTNVEEVTLRPQSYTKLSQGFIVQAKYNNAPLTFANSMRVSTAGGAIFYNKTANPDGEAEGDDDPEPVEIIDRYWLKFINPDNVANNILIAHIAEATNDYDDDYDSSLFSLGNDAFYSVVGTNKLQIQARALPIDRADVIQLGYKNSKAGNCIIALNDKDGVFKNDSKAIYLKDKITGIVTNLQDGYYTFSSDLVTAQNETRFEIIYGNAVLATQASETSALLVYKNNNELVIKGNQNMTSVEIYDAAGKLIRHLSNKMAKEIRIDASAFVKGIYVLKITSDKGITTKKVML